MLDKRIGRDGYPVLIGGQEAGRVTSGWPAPFLKKNIGMAYVPPELEPPSERKSKSALRAGGAGAHRSTAFFTSARNSRPASNREGQMYPRLSLHERTRMDQSSR